MAKAKCRSAEDVIKLLSDLPDNYFTSLDKTVTREAVKEKEAEEVKVIEEPADDSAPEILESDDLQRRMKAGGDIEGIG
ncbi:MAG: hypothetical protein R2744_12490 [Bacteroidales bacterium]